MSNLSEFTKKAVLTVRDVIYSPFCFGCGKAGAFLCDDCTEKFDEYFSPSKHIMNGGNGFADAVFSLFGYKDNLRIRQFLHNIKQYDCPEAVWTLIPYLKKGLKMCDFTETADMITFCPRSFANLSRYGFDQSYEYASCLSRISGIPFEEAVFRRKISVPQHLLTSKGRQMNAKNRFFVKERFDGLNIILFDDIVTTGNTVSEVARVLKGAGAMKVFVFSIAH